MRTPHELLRDATRRSRSRQWSAERWQWTALQSLLYGEPTHYVRLLRGLPAARDGMARVRAARVMQRYWRGRGKQRFANTIDAAAALEHARAAAAVFRRQDGAARTIQARGKGKQVRAAFADLSAALLGRESSARREAAEQLAAAKERRERRRREDAAVLSIQRRGRVVQARRSVHQRKAELASQQTAMASRYVSGLAIRGVATLTRVLQRHRQQKRLMANVYRHAVVAWYEKAALDLSRSRGSGGGGGGGVVVAMRSVALQRAAALGWAGGGGAGRREQRPAAAAAVQAAGQDGECRPADSAAGGDGSAAARGGGGARPRAAAPRPPRPRRRPPRPPRRMRR